MFEVGNIIFIVEIFLAQALLLYSCPKRKQFALRLVLSLAVAVVLAGFFPMPKGFAMNPFYQILRFLTLLAYTMAATAVSYQISARAILSLCVAGYAFQHIAYQSTMLLSSIKAIAAYNIVVFPSMKLFELIVFPVVYAILYFVFGRPVAKSEYYKNSDVKLDILAVFIVFICVVLTRVSYFLSGFNSLSPRFYAIVCCVLALVIQFNLYRMFEEKYEKEVVYQMWKEEKRQYEMSKQMIDVINVKCHDLKFRLHQEGSDPFGTDRREIENAVGLYDGMLKSGNEVLDVILGENALRCQANGIKFTFMGRGGDLGFVAATDMYSLLGNALENAREAVSSLPAEKRVISLTVEKRGSFVNVNVVNYFEGELVFEGDMPKTGKTDEEGYHGYGIKSMQIIAAKYGGNVRISVNADLFSLGIYLFDPSAE